VECNWSTTNLYVWYHPLKIQANCFGIIVSVLGPWNSCIIENILVITCKISLLAINVDSNETNHIKCTREWHHTPQVGDDIRTCAPGKYLSMSAAANRSEPVPERPWTVATWKIFTNRYPVYYYYVIMFSVVDRDRKRNSF
jgi:hypothetical protein